MKKHDLLSMADYDAEGLWALLQLARRLKKRRISRELAGRSVGLIFQKPSTRTAVSFAVGVSQLGGFPLILTSDVLQIKRGESPKDTGRVLSRYLDAIVIRANRHDDVQEMADVASIPVINGLTDKEHPCQVLADLLTIIEHHSMRKLSDLKGFRIGYVGDGNNMANSWMLAAAMLGMRLVVASPRAYAPHADYIEASRRLARRSGAELIFSQDPKDAARGAEALYTDVWTSMGQETESQARRKVFAAYQINSTLLKMAKPGCMVMHCLPAHRGEEITEDVMEGPNSVIFDQAENRLHVQKAVLIDLLGRGRR